MTNRWIATVEAGENDKPKHMDYANASLIAQAPAMADLLRRLLTEYFDPTWPDMHFGFPEEIRTILREIGTRTLTLTKT